MNNNIEIPSGWSEISEDKYSVLGIVNTENIVCLGSFIANESNIVSFINYIGFDRNFLFTLDSAFQSINETNALIDGNPSDKNYTDSSIISNLYHSFTEIDGNEFYVNINRIRASENQYNYSFQIFVEAVNGILCAQATIQNIDEINVLESALQIQCIDETINLLFNLKDIK